MSLKARTWVPEARPAARAAPRPVSWVPSHLPSPGRFPHWSPRTHQAQCSLILLARATAWASLLGPREEGARPGSQPALLPSHRRRQASSPQGCPRLTCSPLILRHKSRYTCAPGDRSGVRSRDAPHSSRAGRDNDTQGTHRGAVWTPGRDQGSRSAAL